jgi:hypothetical protein
MKTSGKKFKCVNLELLAGSINLPSLLAKNAKGSRYLRIITYTLPPKIGRSRELLASPQQPHVEIIAHKEQADAAMIIKQQFPSLRIRLHPTARWC